MNTSPTRKSAHKKKSNITFVVFAYNEEKRIEYPIKNFLPYGNVIISDDGSTDRTVIRAKQLGAQVIKRKVHSPYLESGEETDFIFKHIKTDWVYLGSIDEMVPLSCLEVYKRISNDSSYKLVIQNRKTLMFNKLHEYIPVYTQVKFFRKDALNFHNSRIHDMGTLAEHVKPSEIFFLPSIDEYSIYHFSTHTTKSLLDNFNKYTEIESKLINTKNILFKIIFVPLFYFIMVYVLQRSFRYGIEGLIIAVENSYYAFLLYAKAYERDTHNTKEEIEKAFEKKKNKLLKIVPNSGRIKKIFAYLQHYFVKKLYILRKFKIIYL